ncbi:MULTISPECIES: hypothetical protein [Fructobacillus]|uniref:Uncharacterized protein n=1 Tax=Fructobacillus cardui TaxID=2893170 RepID=A0ABN9YXK2_9LACO|nr:hypothetical protein [Fructobacillus sp. EFB-N1]KMK53327.1 hypothetical protein FEFB_09200 [Fructobacillus sp. EFB-N1]CAK1224953.1 unnamed protein product [Fructobacillus cardui]CAK1247530.1 unnamed protein product [Fructobacillus cardui]CAK1252352.1 unnamed protein product [Fructobacillus cardui]
MFKNQKRNPLFLLALIPLALTGLSRHLSPIEYNLAFSLFVATVAIALLPLQKNSENDNLVRPRYFKLMTMILTGLFAFSGNFLYQQEIDWQMATQNSVSVYPVFIAVILLPAALVYLLEWHTHKN